MRYEWIFHPIDRCDVGIAWLLVCVFWWLCLFIIVQYEELHFYFVGYAHKIEFRPVTLVAIWCIFSMYFLPVFARLEKYIEFLAIHRITSLKISVFGQRLFHVFFLYSGYFFLRVDNVINKNNIDDGMEWKSRRYISQDTMI